RLGQGGDGKDVAVDVGVIASEIENDVAAVFVQRGGVVDGDRGGIEAAGGAATVAAKDIAIIAFFAGVEHVVATAAGVFAGGGVLAQVTDLVVETIQVALADTLASGEVAQTGIALVVVGAADGDLELAGGGAAVAGDPIAVVAGLVAVEDA